MFFPFLLQFFPPFLCSFSLSLFLFFSYFLKIFIIFSSSKKWVFSNLWMMQIFNSWSVEIIQNHLLRLLSFRSFFFLSLKFGTFEGCFFRNLDLSDENFKRLFPQIFNLSIEKTFLWICVVVNEVNKIFNFGCIKNWNFSSLFPMVALSEITFCPGKFLFAIPDL